MLCEFFEGNGYQSGFRKGHSTSGLFNFTDNVVWNLDRDKSAISVFLDFTKAFDLLDHDLLFLDLISVGQNCDIFSSFAEIVSDVPQGSILGPLCSTHQLFTHTQMILRYFLVSIVWTFWMSLTISDPIANYTHRHYHKPNAEKTNVNAFNKTDITWLKFREYVKYLLQKTFLTSKCAENFVKH